jgi:hypothetical protein
MTTQQDVESLTQIISDVTSEPVQEVVAPTIPPGSAEVVLPMGLWSPIEPLRDTAIVRELNGYDEEILARCKSVGAAMQVMLERAVVQIGGKPATQDDLNDMIAGDRMELLLAIRSLTWGEDVETFSRCSHCDAVNETEIEVLDIPRNIVEDKVSARTFTLELSRGEATFRYPSGAFHKKVLANKFATGAETTSAMIADCAVEIPGLVVVTPETAKKMSLRDRQKIVTYFATHLVGPNVDAVPVTCSACGEEYTLALSAGVLFPL